MLVTFGIGLGIVVIVILIAIYMKINKIEDSIELLERLIILPSYLNPIKNWN